MAKDQTTEITVNAIFDGKQTEKQAFIRLIISRKNIDNSQNKLDKIQDICYNLNMGKNSDLRKSKGE